jgi:hypothetical protein
METNSSITNKPHQHLITAYFTALEYKNRTELMMSIEGKSNNNNNKNQAQTVQIEGLHLLIQSEADLDDDDDDDDDLSFANDSLQKNMIRLPRSKYSRRSRNSCIAAILKDPATESPQTVAKAAPFRFVRFSSQAA